MENDIDRMIEDASGKDIFVSTLLRKAYELGYEVGYVKHMESVGWVKEDRHSLLDKASNDSIRQSIIDIYERGKYQGGKDRADGIERGMSQKVDWEEKKKRYSDGPGREEEGVGDKEKEDTYEKSQFWDRPADSFGISDKDERHATSMTGSIDKPKQDNRTKAVEKPKQTRIPSAIRLFKVKGKKKYFDDD